MPKYTVGNSLIYGLNKGRFFFLFVYCPTFLTMMYHYNCYHYNIKCIRTLILFFISSHTFEKWFLQ